MHLSSRSCSPLVGQPRNVRTYVGSISGGWTGTCNTYTVRNGNVICRHAIPAQEREREGSKEGRTERWMVSWWYREERRREEEEEDIAYVGRGMDPGWRRVDRRDPRRRIPPTYRANSASAPAPLCTAVNHSDQPSPDKWRWRWTLSFLPPGPPTRSHRTGPNTMSISIACCSHRTRPVPIFRCPLYSESSHLTLTCH